MEMRRTAAREPWLLANEHQDVEPGRRDDGSTVAAAEDRANFLERCTFWWVFPSICAGNENGRLAKEDLPALPRRDSANALFRLTAAEWRSAEGGRSRGSSASLVRVLCWSIQPRLFLYSFVCGWTFQLLLLIDPLLLRSLLDSTDGNKAEQLSFARQLGLILLLSVSMLARVTCMELCYFASMRVQNNVRSVLVHAIFRKALAVPDHMLDTGKVTNLMATDADKIGKWSSLIWSASVWSWSIISTPVILYFLYELVGFGAVIGIFTMLASASASRALGRMTQRQTKAVQICRDRRARMMGEMLRGIRTVKLQVWEPIWHERIAAAREEEMQALVKQRILGAVNSLVGIIGSMLIPVSIFAWYTLVQQKHLSAAVAFSTLAWISTLQWSLQALPGIYIMIANLKPSLDRIDQFLTMPGEDPSVAWRAEAWLVDRSPDAAPVSGAAEALAVQVRGATFGYTARDSADDGPPSVRQTVVLKDVSLEIQPGELVMIAGAVGSGKSSLLASLAGARPALSGRCAVSGRRAYVSQKPFLLNATICDNILFGLPMDSARYNDAIRLAALPEDLAALQAGDQTLVGENGVQLSGGQRARVALARALFADADVLLLDDVLSAVDAHTGRFLWNECLNGSLRRQRKTVVLVSHQVQYLSHPEVSRIVLLGDGRICRQGTWKELSALPSIDGDNLLDYVSEWHDAGEDAPKHTQEKGNHPAQGTALGSSTVQELEPVTVAECQAAVARSLRALSGRRIDSRIIEGVCDSLAGESESLETMREGNITWPDFQVYLRAFGSLFTVALLAVVMVCAALGNVAMNFWLSVWTSGSGDRSQDEAQRHLGTYASLGVAAGCAVCFQDLVVTVCALAASRSIHTQMVQRLLNAPMAFFDSSPTGRVLNRFLQDLQNIDMFVPRTICDQVTKTLNIFTQLSLVYIEAPWVLCTLPMLAVPYWAIFRRMRVPNRDARRLESVAHSPVYSHFSDTLHGRETVRAYQAEPRFEKENLEHVEAMATAMYANQAINKWAQALTTQWGSMLYFSCGLACIIMAHCGAMSTGQVGLVLLYAGQLQRGMMDYMMGAADLETKFVSVERVAEYMRLDSEEGPPGGSLAGTPGAWWPRDSSISVRGVALRYRLSRALVLRSVSLDIPAKEKVAVCGRTGCGKSSLFGALSRLYPISGGGIFIGGQDIATVPVKLLRAQVRVVSQDAFLLSGSLRQNLTMGCGGSVHDSVLWHTLDVVGMAGKVESLPTCLEFEIEDGGKNFSVGERQLLTLARALVPPAGCSGMADWRPPPVLLCDEATASVDLVADERVHEVVLGLDSTVLMICHRLQHICRFGLVAVMGDGAIAELGPPADLLSRSPPSILAQLRAEAGLS